MVNILISGDFCPSERLFNLVNNEEKNYSIFNDISNVLNNVDYRILNLEAPIVDEKDTLTKKIKKYGPNLFCNENVIFFLMKYNINLVTLANNHIYDYGDEGIKKTLSSLKVSNIDFVGAGININEAKKITYKDIKGIRFSFINFCEHEFSIATDEYGGANPLDIVDNTYQIKKAKENSDYVIVIIHGGHEHYQLPSPRMKKTYRFFADMGADVIVNHHQHCYSGYEIYKKTPIFYGIGNFCFDSAKMNFTSWNHGFSIELIFKRNIKEVTFKIHPYVQCREIPKLSSLNDEESKQFEVNINQLNKIICDDDLLLKEYICFSKKKEKIMLSIFEPYNRFFYFINNILSFFIFKRNRLLLTKNFIYCESYYDLIKLILSRK